MSSNTNAVQMVKFTPIKEMGREYENLVQTEETAASYHKVWDPVYLGMKLHQVNRLCLTDLFLNFKQKSRNI